MVFGHSWKASSSSASSPPPSSSSAAAAAATADNTSNMRPSSSWMMSPSSYSSSSTTSHQPPQHPSVSVFGILSPADVGGGGRGGQQQQQPPPYPSAFIASGGGLYSQSNPHYSSLGSTGGMTAAAAAGTTTTTMPADFDSLLVNSASLLSSVGRRRVGVGVGGSSDGGATTTSTTTGVGVGGGGGRTMMMMMMMGGGASGIIGNENTNTTSSYEAEASAHRLLAREGWGFDSADLGRRARELERKVAAMGGATATGGGGISSSGGEMGSRRRSYNAWNDDDDDDDAQEEKKSSSGGTFDGMNDYYYGNNEPSSSHQQHQSMTLQELLTSHHNYCVEKAIRSSRERAKKLSQQRMEERLQSDWMQRKQEVLGRGKVGHRFLLGSSSSSGGGFNSGGIGVGNELVPMIGNGAEGMNAAPAAGTVYSGIVPSPQLIPSSAERLVKSHLASIDVRLATMTTTTTTAAAAPSTITSSGTNAAAALSLLTSLEEGLKDVALTEGATTATAASSIGTITPECLSGYSNAFSLIRSIVNCRIGLNASSSSSSSSSSTSMMMIPATMAMTYNANNTATDIAPIAVASNVMGTCHFFAQQFASHVREVVQEAELGGWTMMSLNISDLSSTTTTAARDICAFATLTVGKEVVDGRGGIWPRLFYCLRCGDANAANLVLNQFANIGGVGSNVIEDVSIVDPAVSELVSQLASLQQTQPTIFFVSQLLYPTQSMIQSRRRVADLYERIQMRSKSLSLGAGGGMGGDRDPCLHYRDACLAMLGGSESISEVPALESSGLLVKTVEDYLYTSLWHALHAPEMDGVGATGESSGGVGGLRGLAEAVSRLSALVNQWGPTYFEQDEDMNGEYTGASEAVALAARGGGNVAKSANAVPRSGGWAFALPLLASQQYATALAYLAEAGGGLGLLQAAHVGIVMDAAGLSVTDYSLNELSGMSSKSSQQALLPMLVASYSASLQGSDVGAALRYLALMSGKGKFVKEQVQRLVLETRQFEGLAGKVGADGSRSNGALDTHFTKKEVSSLLVDSANHAIRVGKPADAAELLVLSGRFGALFSLMNRELASYLNSFSPEGFAKRQFWFNAASQFHAVHLARGRTYVQNALDAEGNMSLGNTFQLLMNLMVFFDRCRENQWEGAWTLMDDLQLIPRTESEMTVRVEAFRALDNCVRQVFHHVALAAMEALCHIYNVLKQGRASVSIDQHNTTDQSLNEIRTRARLLVTFARLLSLPSLGDADTYVRISQLEKNMM